MTVVYIDSLFLLNLVVNYLLLLASAKVAGEVLCRWRMGLGAALGAVYAAVIFFPGMSFLVHPLCKLSAGILMLLTAFGGTRRLLRITLVFFGVSAAFGGGIFALELLGNQSLTLSNGVFSSALDLRLILLSAAMCYCVITLVFNRSARHGTGELLPCTLKYGARSAALTALLDTGNTLTDPLTGRPVMVAEGACLAELLGERLDLSDPAAALAGVKEPRKFRLLPYHAVGISCGMLLAVRIEEVRIGKNQCRNLLVALSPTPVSDGGAYQALVGAIP